MKTLICLLAATLLLTGCNRTPAPEPPAQLQILQNILADRKANEWEYKSEEIRNENFQLSQDKTLSEDRQAAYSSGPAEFSRYKIQDQLSEIGKDGWELVSVTPLSELVYRGTVPERTGKLLCIFKRRTHTP